MEANNEHNNHDSSADKIVKKPNPKMTKVVSTTESQSMAYFTIRNIESETSIREMDWSLFILKELQDNAFDWLNDNYPAISPEDKKNREIGVRIWITRGEEHQGINDRFIHIAVRDSNVNNVPAFRNLPQDF